MLPPHSPRHRPDPDPSCKPTGFLDVHIDRTLASAIVALSGRIAVRRDLPCEGSWRPWSTTKVGDQSLRLWVNRG